MKILLILNFWKLLKLFFIYFFILFITILSFLSVSAIKDIYFNIKQAKLFRFVLVFRCENMKLVSEESVINWAYTLYLYNIIIAPMHDHYLFVQKSWHPP